MDRFLRSMVLASDLTMFFAMVFLASLLCGVEDSVALPGGIFFAEVELDLRILFVFCVAAVPLGIFLMRLVSTSFMGTYKIFYEDAKLWLHYTLEDFCGFLTVILVLSYLGLSEKGEDKNYFVLALVSSIVFSHWCADLKYRRAYRDAFSAEGRRRYLGAFERVAQLYNAHEISPLQVRYFTNVLLKLGKAFYPQHAAYCQRLLRELSSIKTAWRAANDPIAVARTNLHRLAEVRRRLR